MKAFGNITVFMAVLLFAALTQAQEVWNCSNPYNPCKGDGELCCKRDPSDDPRAGNSVCVKIASCPYGQN